jgi:hypothetical protein
MLQPKEIHDGNRGTKIERERRSATVEQELRQAHLSTQKQLPMQDATYDAKDKEWVFAL